MLALLSRFSRVAPSVVEMDGASAQDERETERTVQQRWLAGRYGLAICGHVVAQRQYKIDQAETHEHHWHERIPRYLEGPRRIRRATPQHDDRPRVRNIEKPAHENQRVG